MKRKKKKKKVVAKAKNYALFVMWLLLPVVCDVSKLDNEKVKVNKEGVRV